MDRAGFLARLNAGCGLVAFFVAVTTIGLHGTATAKLEEGQKAVGFKAVDFLSDEELDYGQYLPENMQQKQYRITLAVCYV